MVSGDHPSLPDHFPGDPIVPGVVILDEVASVIHENRPDLWVCGIERVKFSSPLRPDEPFTVRLTFPQPGQARFECESAHGVFSQGRLRLSPKEEAP